MLYVKNLFVKEFDLVICIGALKPRAIGVIKAYLTQPYQDQKNRPKPNFFFYKNHLTHVSFRKKVDLDQFVFQKKNYRNQN